MTRIPKSVHALRVLWAVGFVLASGGCKFNDESRNTSGITCRGDDECPSNLRCHITLKTCRPKADGDYVAPLLTGGSRARHLRAGETVVVDVEADEALLSAPQLKAQQGDLAWPLLLLAQSGRTYEYGLDVSQDMAEGLWLVLGTASDASGNTTTEAGIGSGFFVDNTAPAIVAESTLISPSRTRSPNDVSVRVAFSESVRPGGQLVVSDEAGQVLQTLSPVNASEALLAFSVPVALDGGAAWSLVVTGVVDRAGNALPEDAAHVGALVIDNTPPVLGALGLEGRGYSSQPGFNDIAVPVVVDDEMAQVELCFASKPCVPVVNGQTAHVAVAAGDPQVSEGPQSLSLRAVDLAGNTAQASSLVVLDFTGPKVVSSGLSLVPAPDCGRASVASLGIGAKVSVHVAVNEFIQGPPDVGDAGLDFALMQVAPHQFVLSATATAATLSGVRALSVLLHDTVGNASVTPLGQFEVDTVRPAALSAAAAERIVLHRAPWGRKDASASSLTIDADAGTLEPHARMTVLSGPNPAAAQVMGRGTTNAEGGLPSLTLSGGDVAEAYVLTEDDACNRAPSTARVGTVELVVGLSSGGASPHSAEVDLATSTRQWRREPGDLIRAPLASMDGHQVTTTAATPGIALAWERRASIPIMNRIDAALAFDSYSGRVVAFGGQRGPRASVTPLYQAGLYEWDGVGWHDLNPTLSGPVARAGHAMTFDEARGRLVVFGGRSDLGVRNDTWEWNGTAWVATAPSVRPSARTHASFAYDARNKVSVLFGGRSATDVALSDTWIWNGTDWTQVQADAGSPSARDFGAATWDESAQRVLLYGGKFADGSARQDSWTWDGKDWTALATTSFAPVRNEGGLVYSPDLGCVLNVGGSQAPSTTATWKGCVSGVLDGGVPRIAWSRLTFAASGNQLRSTFGSSAAYDRTRRAVIHFGGSNVVTGGGAPYDDLNELTPPQGAQPDWTWTRKWNGALDIPNARYGAAVAYDVDRKVTVLEGGRMKNGNFLPETWEFDGDSWDAGNLLTSPERIEHTLVYDEAAHVMLLMGGLTAAPFSASQEVWAWNPTSRVWTLRAPLDGGSPAPRYTHAAAFDSTRGHILMTGGTLDAGVASHADTWTWSAQSWSHLGAGPSKISAAMTYDTGRARAVLFGGLDSTAAASASSATWEHVDGGWVNVTPLGVSIPARARHTFTYDALLNRSVVFGGSGTGGDELADTWLWSGSAWTPAGLSGTVVPTPRQRHAAAYEAHRRRTLVFGGHDVSSTKVFDETWEVFFRPEWKPGHRVDVEWGALGLPTDAVVIEVSPSFVAGASGPEGEGVQLELWNGAVWTTQGTHSSPSLSPTLVTATLSDGDVARVVKQQSLSTRVVPKSRSTTALSTLASDAADVRIVYRLP